MSQIDSKPWYQQVWPWVLISLPVISVCVNMVLISLALNTEDSLVVDDYYKKGKGINLELSRVKKAKELGLSANIQFDKDFVILTLLGYQPTDRTALTLHLRHTTLSRKDQTITLVADASGRYRGRLAADINGKWNLTVEPFSKQWKLQQAVFVSGSSHLTLTP